MSETSHYRKEREYTQPVITITANNNEKSQDRAENVAVPIVSIIYYLKYPVSNINLRHTKKQGSMTQTSEGGKTGTACKKSQISYLKDKVFQASIINMFKENHD